MCNDDGDLTVETTVERETKSSRIFLGADGIMLIEIKGGAVFTLLEARENVEVAEEMLLGRRIPLLIDIRKVRSIDRAARIYFASEEAVRSIRAQAMLFSSPVSRIIANFFLGFNQPPCPTRIFNSEARAMEWLRGFVR